MVMLHCGGSSACKNSAKIIEFWNKYELTVWRLNHAKAIRFILYVYLMRIPMPSYTMCIYVCRYSESETTDMLLEHFVTF